MIHPKYIQGDLFSSAHYQKHEPVIIAHVCNNLGLWGAGFALTFKRRHPKRLKNSANGSKLRNKSRIQCLVNRNW